MEGTGANGNEEDKANGGNCLVSWAKVQRPYVNGGLGIHDLKRMSWVLCIC